jgi:uncharacterized membrane protein
MTPRAALFAVVLGLAAAAGCEDPAPPLPPAPVPAPAPPPPSPPEPLPPAVAPAPAAPPKEEPPAGPPLRVLYLDGDPRWEFQYLSNLLVRDPSMRAWAWLGAADPQAPQRRTEGLPAVDAATALASRESLAEYDVVILGDLDVASLGRDAGGVAARLRDYVAHGGGLVLLAGAQHMPSGLAGTPLEELLPVRLDKEHEVVVNAATGSSDAIALRVTKDGESCPFLDVLGDGAASKSLWETHEMWRQYWAFPVREARAGAQVLIEGTRKLGDRAATGPVVVSATFGEGRVLYVGVDELWRIRYDVGDRYYGRFWKGAIRWLAPAKR